MFRLFQSKKHEVQTPIGPGISHCDSPHGQTLEVKRYHRGNVLHFSWPAADPRASRVPAVVADIQLYIDQALNQIESDEEWRKIVIQQGGVYPDGVHWFREYCDFTLTFGYFDWPDGTLSFDFRDGQIVGTDVGD